MKPPSGIPTTRDTLNSLYKSKPLILAHRGASYDAPENTIAAFRLAQSQGADGIELDTCMTRDGVPVVIHNLTLDETTDGHGAVRDLNIEQIKNLDAGSYFDNSFQKERIPTLYDAFDAIGHDMVVNVELKTISWRTDGIEEAVWQAIQICRMERRVIVSSFNPFALRRFRKLAPQIPIGYLYAPAMPPYLRYGWFMLGLPHEARHPQHEMIDLDYMRWARANGFRVHCWTVDDPARIRALSNLGVDAIITNRPDVALAALGRVNARRFAT